MRVVVIGGGVGGLTAAVRLTALGHRVSLYEARGEVGGLASGISAGGLSFDGGPYILLDRPGLQWAFERVGIDVGRLDLQPVPALYEVNAPTSAPVRIFLDLERTKEALERNWPGAGLVYDRFVSEMESLRRRLAPLLVVSHPSIVELARAGALGAAPFLFRSLNGVLRRTGLPREIVDAIAFWTHVAGQSLRDAPSVMAFVPALIHRVGAFVPKGGMRRIPEVLAEQARWNGVDIQCSARVRRVRTADRRVTGVELERGEVVSCEAVVSNYHGVGTYDELVDDVPPAVRQRLLNLPL
jgi:phytoene dehydrogenase-like protein